MSAEVQALQINNNALTTQILALQQEKTNLTNSLREEKQKNQQCEQEKVKINTELQEKKKAETQSQGRVKELETQLQGRVKELETQQGKIKELEQQIQQQKNMIAQTEKDLQTTKDSLAKNNLDKQNLEKSKDEEIKLLNEDNQKQQKQSSEWKKKYEDKELKYDNLVTENKQLAADLEKKTNKETASAKENTLLKEEILKINNEFCASQKNVTTLKDEEEKRKVLLEEKNNKLTISQTENEKLRQKLQETQTEFQKKENDLQSQIKNQQIVTEQKNQTIKDLQTQITNLNQEKGDVYKLTTEQKTEIEELQKRIKITEEESEKILDSSKEKEEKYLARLNKQSEVIEQLKKEKTQQKQEIDENEKQIEGLQKKQDLLIQNLKQKEEEFTDYQNSERERNYELNKFKEQQERLEARESLINESQQCYDITLDLKSMNNLSLEPQQNSNDEVKGGLIIKYSNQEQKGLFKNALVVGCKGPQNNGKSHVLNMIANLNFPSSFNSCSRGLGLKGHHANNKYFVYIESEGDSRLAKRVYEDNEHYNKFMQNMKTERREDIESKMLLQSCIERNNEDVKRVQQLFQNFMIQNSNILLVVISELSVQEKELIEAIHQQNIIKQTDFEVREIIVVHNKMNLRTVKSMERFIENELKTIFPLEEHVYKIDSLQRNEQHVYYKNNLYPHMEHVIIGYEDSEAGQFYNNFAYNYLKLKIQLCKGGATFDVPNKLKQFLNEQIESFVTLKTLPDEVTQTNSKKELFVFNEDKTLLHLKEGIQIEKLREQKSNPLKYSIRENKENTDLRAVYVEVPIDANLKRKYLRSEGVLELIIRYNSDLETEYGKQLQSNRNFEEILHKIQVCKKGEIWERISENSNENLNNGMYKFVFKKQISPDYE